MFVVRIAFESNLLKFNWLHFGNTVCRRAPEMNNTPLLWFNLRHIFISPATFLSLRALVCCMKIGCRFCRESKLLGTNLPSLYGHLTAHTVQFLARIYISFLLRNADSVPRWCRYPSSRGLTCVHARVRSFAGFHVENCEGAVSCCVHCLHFMVGLDEYPCSLFVEHFMRFSEYFIPN